MFIHVGYAKAGSSWLQQRFRSAEAGFYHPLAGTDCLYDNLVSPNALTFDATAARNAINEALEGNAADSSLVPVLSLESLIGHWSSGGWNAAMMVDRIAAVFEAPKVLLVIRAQDSMLSSVYRQYVRKGGARNMQKFFFPPIKGRARAPGFSFQFFCYHALIEYMYERLGRENVLVLPMEMMKEEADAYLEKICSFAGATPQPGYTPEKTVRNEGLTITQVLFKRKINPFIARDQLNDYSILYSDIWHIIGMRLVRFLGRDFFKKADKKREKAFRAQIGTICDGRFEESNRKTAELIGIDLSKYGYRM